MNPQTSNQSNLPIRRSILVIVIAIAVFCLFIIAMLSLPALLNLLSKRDSVKDMRYNSPLTVYLNDTATQVSLGVDPSNTFRYACTSEAEMDQVTDELLKLKLSERKESGEMTDVFVVDLQYANAKQISLYFSLDGFLRMESNSTSPEVCYFKGNAKDVQKYLSSLQMLLPGGAGVDSPLCAYLSEAVVSAKFQQKFSAKAINTLGICTDRAVNQQVKNRLEQLSLSPTFNQEREVPQAFLITLHDGISPLKIQLGQGDNSDYVSVTKNDSTCYFLTDPAESAALIQELTDLFLQYQQGSAYVSPFNGQLSQVNQIYLQRGLADYSEPITSQNVPRTVALLFDLRLTEIPWEPIQLKDGDYSLTASGNGIDIKIILRGNHLCYFYRQNTPEQGAWRITWYSFPAEEAVELYALLEEEWNFAATRLQRILSKENFQWLLIELRSTGTLASHTTYDQTVTCEVIERILSAAPKRSDSTFAADTNPDEVTLFLTFSCVGKSFTCSFNNDCLTVWDDYTQDYNNLDDSFTYRINPEVTAELLAYLENYMPGADVVVPDEVANFGNKAAIRYALERLGLTLTERVDHLALVSEEFFQTKAALCLTSMQYDTPQQAQVLTMFWNYTLDTPLSAQEIAELHAEDRSDRKVVRFTEEELLTILSTYFAEMPMDAQTLHQALENSNYYRYLESTDSWYCFVSGSNPIPSPLATYLTESGELVVFLNSGYMAVLREVNGSYRFVANRKIA